MGASIAPAPDNAAVEQQTADAQAAATPGLIQRIRGADYPPMGIADDAKLTAFVDGKHRETEPEALARYKQAVKNIFYANGRQHIGWLGSRRCYDDLPTKPKEIRVTMNMIRPILRSRAARLMSSPVNYVVIPKDNSFQARDAGKAAVNWLIARMRVLEADQRIRQALSLTFCTGVGAFKTFWNRDIGVERPATKIFPVSGVDESGQPNGQVQMQELFVNQQKQPVASADQAFMYKPGDTDFGYRSIFNLRWNPEAQGFTAGEGLRYLIDSEVVPLSVARELFPDIADRIRPYAGTESYVTYERMAQASAVSRPFGAVGQTLLGGTSSTRPIEQCVIREYWELPSRFYRKGRVIVVVGGVAAYDGEFPYGFFPYTAIYDEVASLVAGGRPCVNDMISPQDVINDQWSAINQEMKASAIGQFAAFNIPGVVDQITNATDSVLRIPLHSQMIGKGIGDIVKRMDGATAPADRWRMIEKAHQELYDIGAYHEISRGQIPPGLDSGVAIEHLQESEAGQLHDASESLKKTLLNIGLQQLRLAKWGYGADESRIVPVDRPDLRYTIETVSGRSLPDPDEIGLDIENFRPRSEAAFRAEVKEWMEAGAIDPRSALSMVDMGRGLDSAFTSSTRDYAKARMENLAIERAQFLMGPAAPNPITGQPTQPLLNVDGSPFLYPDDDNHAIHIDVVYEIAKDLSKPWPMREIALMHAAEHRMAAMAQQLAQQPPPPPDEGEGAGKSEKTKSSSGKKN